MENADFEKHVKEIAKKEPVSWVKTHNPARLVEALREEYSNRELLKKEAEIKRFMKFTKHGLNFSFRDHFDSVSHPSDDISSSTDTSSQSTESEPDIDLAEIGQIFEGDGAPHRLPAPILSFRDITALSSRNPLGLLQVRPIRDGAAVLACN
ncbi:uncharacterized protein A1O5_08296 [Cladophialophora psammophila CBS 110553]|uniref:Uncharacterized protein n=1 Tax=Cladophialophora psammophila CBS 110553 TaxID=1182543 RepID=W9WKS0_9EURO|nr:uncharacterized protein A1O5_08296 [Cladophialophora psammophila CBS 110553]EXJ68503.1 hypothetical protein A1O5_08296 [Cladophialophora psammophila CBS 110553]